MLLPEEVNTSNEKKQVDLDCKIVDNINLFIFMILNKLLVFLKTKLY